MGFRDIELRAVKLRAIAGRQFHQQARRLERIGQGPPCRIDCGRILKRSLRLCQNGRQPLPVAAKEGFYRVCNHARLNVRVTGIYEDQGSNCVEVQRGAAILNLFELV